MNTAQELVERFKNGDRSVFAAIVEMHQQMVYNTALNIVQNSADADDITQEVFVKVFVAVSSFKGESKFSTWLYQVTIAKALDHERKKKRKKRFGFMQSLWSVGEEDEPAVTDHPGIQLENKEAANDLLQALKKLPDKQRIAFTLFSIQGKSQQEIAAIMSISVTAVESLVARAKTNLRDILYQYYKRKQ